MGGSFRDVPKLLRQAFDHLNPGGWIEWQEYESVVKTDDDSLPPDSAIARWIVNLNKATDNFGKELNIAPKLKLLMEEAGFVNVSDKTFTVRRLPHYLLTLICRPILLNTLLSGSNNAMAQGPQTQAAGGMEYARLV